MTTLPSLVERKAALRIEMLARRAEVAARSATGAAAAVAERLVREVSLAVGAVVAGYWPLEGELDPRPAMARLAERGHALALPRMQGRLRPLRFHRWRRERALVQGSYRVLEPSAREQVLWPDVVLVPLLAFDHRGQRLGYGAGFYDRTLAELRGDKRELLALGLAFAAQEVAEVPVEPPDQPLDGVITEEAFHWCRARQAAAQAGSA